jgi:hypothetical protein
MVNSLRMVDLPVTRWYKPQEKLPEHNEQVLVRMGDYIDLALFNQESKVFVLRTGIEYSTKDDVTWMGLLMNQEL